jgi:hypothetical protein
MNNRIDFSNTPRRKNAEANSRVHRRRNADKFSVLYFFLIEGLNGEIEAFYLMAGLKQMRRRRGEIKRLMT